MTPMEAIWVLLAIVIIFAVAYAVDYFAMRAAGTPVLPPPIRIAIWGVAAVLAVLVLLWGLDVIGPATVTLPED